MLCMSMVCRGSNPCVPFQRQLLSIFLSLGQSTTDYMLKTQPVVMINSTCFYHLMTCRCVWNIIIMPHTISAMF